MPDPTPSSGPDVPADAPDSPWYDFTPDLLASFPLTELAAAIRSRVDATLADWAAEVRGTVAIAARLPQEQLLDNVPQILLALADAVGSTDAVVRRRLLARSPSQGVTRFQQHYDPRDLMFEDRQLRKLLVAHVGQALGRPMTPIEQLALGMGLDLMSQQAVVAYIEHQVKQLREATEAELRYLSFLSHDLNNNLSGVTMWLQVLKTQLQPKPELAEQVTSIDAIQESILQTIGGMGRLLQAERLRHGGRVAEPRPVDLRSLVTNQTRAAVEVARRRDVRFVVDVPKGAVVVTDPDLLTLVLQNLIGNAAKFGAPGVVEVRASSRTVEGGRTQWSIAVVDHGPGIEAEHVDRIFRAFQRGTMQGKAGLGLGLAIASRSAAMLGGTLTVDSTLGRGSTFTLTLPPS